MSISLVFVIIMTCLRILPSSYDEYVEHNLPSSYLGIKKIELKIFNVIFQMCSIHHIMRD